MTLTIEAAADANPRQSDIDTSMPGCGGRTPALRLQLRLVFPSATLELRRLLGRAPVVIHGPERRARQAAQRGADDHAGRALLLLPILSPSTSRT